MDLQLKGGLTTLVCDHVPGPAKMVCLTIKQNGTDSAMLAMLDRDQQDRLRAFLEETE